MKYKVWSTVLPLIENSAPRIIHGQCERVVLTVVFQNTKIGPWGPELIWYLATKCKMGRQQVPAVYHHLNHDKWGVADLTWQSYIPLDLK